MTKDKKQIIVVAAGWVFIGKVTEQGDNLLVNNCQNIRLWGTTTGLGQIALSGPTRDTVLDDYGVVNIPKSQVIYRIDCVV